LSFAVIVTTQYNVPLKAKSWIASCARNDDG